MASNNTNHVRRKNISAQWLYYVGANQKLFLFAHRRVGDGNRSASAVVQHAGGSLFCGLLMACLFCFDFTNFLCGFLQVADETNPSHLPAVGWVKEIAVRWPLVIGCTEA